MTYELGVPRKKPAMETAPTCPTNTASLSDESKCADYAKMAGKSFNTADLPNYPRGCSDRIDHPQFAGVWWNSAKEGTWDQQEGAWWNQHQGFTGEVALVCEPTMPHLTTCDDHLAQALTAYWEYGDCGYWGNDYNQGLCGGLLSGDCPEFWDKPENSDYIIFSEAEKMWEGISAEIKCVRAQLKSFVTSTAFTQERIFTSDGKGNRKGNIGEAVSWKGAKCNSNCHYLWHAQYECVETATTEQKLDCIKIITGSQAANDGLLTVNVDAGGGMFEVASGSFSTGSTVLQKCFSTKIQGVQVQNINWNAWTGSIEVSRDGGATYNAMQCDDCTVAGRTTNIVVDGDGDAGNQASTTCLDGKLCGLS